jgi:hypothetical protein
MTRTVSVEPNCGHLRDHVQSGRGPAETAAEWQYIDSEPEKAKAGWREWMKAMREKQSKDDVH